MIPLEDCKHAYLYRISARNFSLGVFDAEVKGFVGIREKFGTRYLFTEYHYDTGAPFGTVFPQEELGPCPIQDLAGFHRQKNYDEGLGKEIEVLVTNKLLFGWLEEANHLHPQKS